MYRNKWTVAVWHQCLIFVLSFLLLDTRPSRQTFLLLSDCHWRLACLECELFLLRMWEWAKLSLPLVCSDRNSTGNKTVNLNAGGYKRRDAEALPLSVWKHWCMFDFCKWTRKDKMRANPLTWLLVWMCIRDTECNTGFSQEWMCLPSTPGALWSTPGGIEYEAVVGCT